MNWAVPEMPRLSFNPLQRAVENLTMSGALRSILGPNLCRALLR
jgi:hypothetical protein